MPTYGDLVTLQLQPGIGVPQRHHQFNILRRLRPMEGRLRLVNLGDVRRRRPAHLRHRRQQIGCRYPRRPLLPPWLCKISPLHVDSWNIAFV